MAATSKLTLRYVPDNDGTGELFVEATSNGFSGKGSAWFRTKELQDFGAKLRDTYPLVPGPQFQIRGGYWNRDFSDALEQEHVGLRVYPIGSLGLVGVRVHLATHVHEGTRNDSQSTAEFELLTNYEALRQFGCALFEVSERTPVELSLNTNDA